MKFNFKSVIAVMLFMCAGLINPAQSATKKETLKVATFNIRQDIASDSTNSWKFRKAHACEFLRKSQPSIIGMQEVLHHQLTDILDALPEYNYVGVGREDGATRGEYMPIIFRKSQFKLLDSNTFWLSEDPTAIGKLGWDAACPRVVTWAKLQDNRNGKIFYAFNTHFDHIGTVARKNSADLILKKINEIAGDNHVILTGDFNSTRNSVPYKELTANNVLFDTEKLADKCVGPDWTFHSFGRDPIDKRIRIDYIFTNKKMKVQKHEVISEKNPKIWLSDHNPIITTLIY